MRRHGRNGRNGCNGCNGWQATLESIIQVKNDECDAATFPTLIAQNALWSRENCDKALEIVGQPYFTASGGYLTATPDLLSPTMYDGNSSTLAVASQKVM